MEYGDSAAWRPLIQSEIESSASRQNKSRDYAYFRKFSSNNTVAPFVRQFSRRAATLDAAIAENLRALGFWKESP